MAGAGLTPPVAGTIALRVLRRPEGPVAAEPLTVGPDGATIGRAPDCDLVLADPLRMVSRQHARLVPQDADAGVIHCLSTSGPLWVNDETVPPGGERIVRCGEKLRIGGFELLVEPARVGSAAAQVRRALADFASPAPPAAKPRAPLAAAEPAPVAPAPRALSPVPTPPAVLAAQVVPAEPGRSRLDRWFDLDHVVDPLAPGSPLPTLVSQVAARAVPAALVVPYGASASAPQRVGDAAHAPSAEAARADMPDRAAPALSAAGPAVCGPADLMDAFMRGAGLATPSMTPQSALTAEWMQHVGAVLRAATEGTLALLHSRAVAKREIRAEGTRILPRENNPLKFAPDTSEALARLLDPHQARGFLPPVEALRDAHSDLLVHQVAMAAGMRAAVFEMISRLGPEALESEQGPARGAALLFPPLRDAALWQRHRERHAHLLDHLDDDFEDIFGREFLRAYEAQSRLTGEKS